MHKKGHAAARTKSPAHLKTRGAEVRFSQDAGVLFGFSLPGIQISGPPGPKTDERLRLGSSIKLI